MSDALKWGLLAATFLIIVAAIFALPVAQGIDLVELSSTIKGIISIAGDYFLKARNLINNFLTPVGRSILSVVIGYVLFKWVYTVSLKTVITIYHWIFK